VKFKTASEIIHFIISGTMVFSQITPYHALSTTLVTLSMFMQIYLVILAMNNIEKSIVYQG
jgi:hypothetical protein